jgi:hypothetical protein
VSGFDAVHLKGSAQTREAKAACAANNGIERLRALAPSGGKRRGAYSCRLLPFKLPGGHFVHLAVNAGGDSSCCERSTGLEKVFV